MSPKAHLTNLVLAYGLGPDVAVQADLESLLVRLYGVPDGEIPVADATPEVARLLVHTADCGPGECQAAPLPGWARRHLFAA